MSDAYELVRTPARSLIGCGVDSPPRCAVGGLRVGRVAEAWWRRHDVTGPAAFRESPAGRRECNADE